MVRISNAIIYDVQSAINVTDLREHLFATDIGVKEGIWLACLTRLSSLECPPSAATVSVNLDLNRSFEGSVAYVMIQ